MQFHGDYSPGGGFQAGDHRSGVHPARAGFRLKLAAAVSLWLNIWLLVAGVLIYVAVGVVSMGLNGLFLDYNVLAASRGWPAYRNFAGRVWRWIDCDHGDAVAFPRFCLVSHRAPLMLTTQRKSMMIEAPFAVTLAENWNYLVVITLMMSGLFIVISRLIW